MSSEGGKKGRVSHETDTELALYLLPLSHQGKVGTQKQMAPSHRLWILRLLGPALKCIQSTAT